MNIKTEDHLILMRDSKYLIEINTDEDITRVYRNSKRNNSGDWLHLTEIEGKSIIESVSLAFKEMDNYENNKKSNRRV